MLLEYNSDKCHEIQAVLKFLSMPKDWFNFFDENRWEDRFLLSIEGY